MLNWLMIFIIDNLYINNKFVCLLKDLNLFKDGFLTFPHPLLHILTILKNILSKSLSIKTKNVRSIK